MRDRSWVRKVRTRGRHLAARLGLIGVYFRWWERRLAKQASRPANDGLPMPPADLITLIQGTPDELWFSEQGKADVATIAALMEAHGGLDSVGALLDWGCGCGRTARWLAPRIVDSGGDYIGCDINPALVGWCAAHLPGRYLRNRLEPPLDLPADSIDLVYAHSVLTHLREPSAKAWLAEVRRVLRRGGVAILTFHDEAYAARWAPAEVVEQLKARDYVVWNDALEGSNYLSAWTTRQHMAELCAGAFEVLEIRPGQQDEPHQAIAVLRAV